MSKAADGALFDAAYEIPAGTLPRYVLMQKDIKKIRELVPFSWAEGAKQEIIIKPELSGLIPLRDYLLGLDPGSMASFKALLKVHCDICSSVIRLKNYFITEEMTDISSGRIYIEPGNERSAPSFAPSSARLAPGRGGALHAQLCGLLAFIHSECPALNPGIIIRRLAEEMSKGWMTAEDLYAFFSLWLLEL